MRVAICQPLIPKYRVPVFEALAARRGIELTVFSGGSQGSLKAMQGVAEYREVDAPLRNIRLGPLEARFQWGQVRATDPARFDVVILSWDARYLSLPFAITKGKLRKIPVLLWGHGYSKAASNVRDRVRKFYGRMADGVLLYSRTTAESLIANEGFRRDQVFVAQNAIDQRPIQQAMDQWSGRHEELLRFRKEHGLDPERTVVFVSRLERDNEIELLLQAFITVAAKFPSARLVLIGDGSQREELEDSARRIGIAERTIFAGAIYDEDSIAPWMMSSTVFAYPTNIGLSLMHAFGYGLPVITCDNIARHGPEIEALISGKNGLLYREHDPQDFARQIIKLFEDKQTRQRMAESARRQVTEIYSLDNMVLGFIEALDFAAKRADWNRK